MPSILFLPAPGSPISLSRSVTHILRLSPSSLHISNSALRCCTPSTVHHRRCSLLGPGRRPQCLPPYRPPPAYRWQPLICGVRDVRLHDSPKPSRRNYPGNGSRYGDVAKDRTHASMGHLEGGEGALDKDLGTQRPAKQTEGEPFRFRAQLSRRSRKSLRPSLSTQVLASINGPARELYLAGSHNEIDLRRASAHHDTDGSLGQLSEHAELPRHSARLRGPATLSSILVRYLDHHTEMEIANFEFRFTDRELELLRSRGYTSNSVGRWALCLLEPKSNVAAKVFEPGVEMPPFFLLQLFLRRKHLKTLALGVVMRHIDHRTRVEPCTWENLKVLVSHLLQHGRESWPESLPWIASLFVTAATRLHTCNGESNQRSAGMLADLTQFCNSFLALLSLPTTLYPLISARYQEKAQFLVLQYMASASPAIMVNRVGFRSVVRTQLAHPKTEQEREWAELKGPSWPPWKENRTAMDEDKGYEFGISRALKILHRMYEAGYGGQTYEHLAEVYAGWNSDLSPTVQTRTSVPRFSQQFKDYRHLRALLWAGRIRTTRTRREAWACFLAHESSNTPPHQDIYHAMFEKLHYPVMERAPTRDLHTDFEGEVHRSEAGLLPGDMKEVLPDSKSPLHHVFLSESIPTYIELYHRMRRARLRPSGRLLAFLLETWPEFTTMLDILAESKDYPGSGLANLVYGVHDHDNAVNTMPDYMFSAFIRFLCRFGGVPRVPSIHASFMEPEQHASYFKSDIFYLLEYAYALLVRYRPKYRPAWAAYMDKIIHQRSSGRDASVARYKIVCGLLDIIEQVDMDVDAEIFRLACIATFHAVQAIEQGFGSIDETRSILLTGSARLRTLFHNLVGANADMQQPASTQDNVNTIPPQIPGPAVLHVYVRALGILRDYEGLYSFSTWLTRNHREVIAQAEARHSDSRRLHRTLVALRAAVDGDFEVGSRPNPGAPAEIAQLIQLQIEGLEGWGGWPTRLYVDMYLKGGLKSSDPVVRGQ